MHIVLLFHTVRQVSIVPIFPPLCWCSLYHAAQATAYKPSPLLLTDDTSLCLSLAKSAPPPSSLYVCIVTTSTATGLPAGSQASNWQPRSTLACIVWSNPPHQRPTQKAGCRPKQPNLLPNCRRQLSSGRLKVCENGMQPVAIIKQRRMSLGKVYPQA